MQQIISDEATSSISSRSVGHEMSRWQDRRCDRRGTTTVEFALTFPIILSVFMAMLFFVQVNLFRSTAEMASYSGAREGLVVGASVDDIQNAAQNVMASIGVVHSEVLVDLQVDTVEVTVNIPMMGNSWSTGYYFPTDMTLTSSCTLIRPSLD